MMDTIISIKIPSTNNSDEIFESVYSELKRIEKKFSKTSEESIIYEINTRPQNVNSFNLDEEEKYLLETAKHYYNSTDGYFDISMFTFGQFWNFNLSEDTMVPVILEKMKTVTAFIGGDNFTISDSSITFKNSVIKIDLGGIAKGYAIDKAVEIIRGFNINSAIINAGGDVFVIGAKNNSDYWNVAIQHPEKFDDYSKILKLKNSAAATSGDYQRFVTFESKKYNHIFNPKTHKNTDYFISVTVVAPTALEADVFATAIFAAEQNFTEVLEKIKKQQPLIKIYYIKKVRH